MITFGLGSIWCAVCPWDVMATWFRRLYVWGYGNAHFTQRRVPKVLRNIWPASVLFITLTWLELGLDIRTDPFGTAVLALAIVVLALLVQVRYERKAFCRYFCAVGRTIGFYASLSPVALRPVDQSICNDCKTLECYKGTETIEPCPTHLVIGRTTQNTFCTSCGSCSQSCPYQNVNWSLRRSGEEAFHHVRPRWDETWFILTLVCLTSFHGIWQLPVVDTWLAKLTGSLTAPAYLLSVAFVMLLSLMAFGGLVATLVKFVHRRIKPDIEYKRFFSVLGLPFIPLAFAYHVAHNLRYLVWQGSDITQLLIDPPGLSTQLASHSLPVIKMHSPLLSVDMLAALQSGLMILGFWFAITILQHCVARLAIPQARQRIGLMLVMTGLIFTTNMVNLILLVQPMLPLR